MFWLVGGLGVLACTLTAWRLISDMHSRYPEYNGRMGDPGGWAIVAVVLYVWFAVWVLGLLFQAKVF